MVGQILQNEVIRVRTPNGTLFAIIVENEDKSIHSFQFTIGKAGTDVTAWACAMAEMMTLCIKKGATLEELIETLSNITSSREARSIDSNCRSGPEGLWMALVRYKRSKFEELNKLLGVDKHSRGASVAPWANTRER